MVCLYRICRRGAQQAVFCSCTIGWGGHSRSVCGPGWERHSGGATGRPGSRHCAPSPTRRSIRATPVTRHDWGLRRSPTCRRSDAAMGKRFSARVLDCGDSRSDGCVAPCDWGNRAYQALFRPAEKPDFCGKSAKTYISVLAVVGIGAVFTLARFSEAFLVLRAMQGGLSVALIPLVMVAMNLVYAVSAYPAGKLADRMEHRTLLMIGVAVLIAADLILAYGDHWTTVLAGATLWGLHMGLTQGLLATMVADTAPVELRGTAFGFFYLVSGVAMLTASTVAGVIWERLGAPATFYLGALFSLLTLALLAIPRRTSTGG